MSLSLYHHIGCDGAGTHIHVRQRSADQRRVAFTNWASILRSGDGAQISSALSTRHESGENA